MNLTDQPQAAFARACSNVALVKYWGKLDDEKRIPATGSLSVTMADLFTETRVAFHQGKGEDHISLNEQLATGREAARIQSFLDRVRKLARELGRPLGHATVRTKNVFPTAAGLASSASGFAALSAAASKAAGIELSMEECATLARLGSASAARSVHGGFVELVPGKTADDAWDARVAQVASDGHWDLRILVVVIDPYYKPLGSTPAMTRSAETSPYYQAWLDTWGKDLAECREAVIAKDFEQLASVSEHSALKLHSCIMTCRPPVQYLRGPSIDVMHEVWALRKNGVPCFFTADAGPNVKVICAPDAAARVSNALEAIPGVRSIGTTKVGPPVHVEPLTAEQERPMGVGDTLRAPGKLFLAGEYGVLAEGSALIAAVNRFATLDARRPNSDPFVDDLLKAMQFTAPAPAVDSTSLFEGPRKLGLGSSAATAVVLSAFSQNTCEPERVFPTALAAHQQLGGGSGGDVAASVYGGVIRYGQGEVESIQLPLENWPIVLLGSEPVSTRERLAHLDQHSARGELLATATQAGNALTAALQQTPLDLEAVRASAQALAAIEHALGGSSQAAFEAASREVEKLGGALKPSGAGAGDIMLAFFADLAISQRVEMKKALRSRGLNVIDLEISDQGVHAS